MKFLFLLFTFFFAHFLHCDAEYRLYTHFGAHPTAKGTKFTLFAPNAQSVSVLVHKNKKTKMRRLDSGIWEAEIAGVKEGSTYTYQIRTKQGKKISKIDPFACKMRPHKGKYQGIVHYVDKFQWTDAEWLEKRKKFTDKNCPISIYEVHIGSWEKKTSFKQLAAKLGPYCKKLGFTHVEVFGLFATASKTGWGYRPLSFFAHTDALQGNFEEFVNEMHRMEIGVIIDWIPGHFSTNFIGLENFDGTPLYEYQDLRMAWGARLFDYSKTHVQNFLLSSAHFWLDQMHVDGIRVDSLDTMVQNASNPQDVQKSMHTLNTCLKPQFPGVVTIAESWDVPNTTSEQGFGFDYKWSGGTNRILKFLTMDFKKRHGNDARNKPLFNAITEAMKGQNNEKLLWHTDHDKSRKETGSLYQQMPGTHFEKCAHVRLFIGYLLTLVGKKMIFMGDELAQKTDWDTRLQESAFGSSVEWECKNDPCHAGVQSMVESLNTLYREQTALHHENILTVCHTDMNNHVICYRRDNLVFVCNFGRQGFDRYTTPLSVAARTMREIFTSDSISFGGSGKTNPVIELDRNVRKKAGSFTIQLPALSVLIFELEY